jgi:hypothetical protein
MSDKKNTCYNCIHSGDNHDMNSAHIHCKLFWKAGNNSRSEYPKGNEEAIKNGWYDFPYNFDPVWMEEDCKYHIINPSKI